MKLGQPLATLRMTDGVPSSFGASQTAPPNFKIQEKKKLTKEEEEEMAKRLVEIEHVRRTEGLKKLQRKYMTDPLTSPRKKLTPAEMEEQVERHYKQAQVNHQTRLSRAQAKYTEKETHTKLSSEKMEENVGRLYNLEMEKQKVKIARLRKKYNYDLPEGKKVTADDVQVLSARLYEESCNKKKETMQALHDEYVTNASPWINGRVLSAAEVEACASRLTTKG
mmetsp:Transcript_146342/g.255588  ORF Transcript_146342/g.255588 Transcript_146342/m.255588 type:complete len:223 (-) Transcript_146342:1098-1766(-)